MIQQCIYKIYNDIFAWVYRYTHSQVAENLHLFLIEKPHSDLSIGLSHPIFTKWCCLFMSLSYSWGKEEHRHEEMIKRWQGVCEERPRLHFWGENDELQLVRSQVVASEMELEDESVQRGRKERKGHPEGEGNDLGVAWRLEFMSWHLFFLTFLAWTP